MSYKNYTLENLTQTFGLKEKRQLLFTDITPIATSPFLQSILQETLKLPKRSEKSRCEAIIFPILLEMKRNNSDYFTIYSGEILNADKQRGLIGECDFILGKNNDSIVMNYPLFCLIEAKKHDIEASIGQCAAQMLGARLYNQRHGQEIPIIYGCVTNADNWQFLKLDNDTIIADTHYYYFDHLDLILGVLQKIIDFYKTTLVD
jgi:hypothetical protein